MEKIVTEIAQGAGRQPRFLDDDFEAESHTWEDSTTWIIRRRVYGSAA
jgi:hypothetical protein